MIPEIRLILDELEESLNFSDSRQTESFLDKILEAHNIVLVGAGRVGLSVRSFATRLSQLNLNSFMLGDSNVPSLNENDLLIVGSGSGETKTILELVKISSKRKVNICLITTSQKSSMAELANNIVLLNAPSKLSVNNIIESKQPMTTLFEQSLYLYLDAVVLKLMARLHESSGSMWNRHSVLE